MKKARIALFLALTFLICGNLIAYSVGTPNNVSEPIVKVPILLYHHIQEFYDPTQNLVNIATDELRLHFMTLKKAGYNSITLAEYVDYVQKGTPLPPKPIIITFDDGYTSNYEIALPMLKEFDMKATIFIVTNSVGAQEKTISYPHFSWEQAKKLQDSGIVDIQSHTNTHAELDKLNYNDLLKELRLSKYLIEKNLGKKCDMIAYPFGFHNDHIIETAKKAGYKVHLLVENEGCNTKNTPLTKLRRITVSGDISNKKLLKLIDDNLAI